jgi:hypothetical protein
MLDHGDDNPVGYASLSQLKDLCGSQFEAGLGMLDVRENDVLLNLGVGELHYAFQLLRQ